jgi:hypothetical protein
MRARWEHYEHEADIGVRGFGATKAEAFAQASAAMTAAMTDLAAVRPLEPVAVHYGRQLGFGSRRFHGFILRRPRRAAYRRALI